MTQEELDAMMNGDIDIESEISENSDNEELSSKDNDDDYGEAAKDYHVSAEQKWPPPPPTSEHKVVHQLDEVTKETEEKSGKIFDVLEEFSNGSMEIENQSNEAIKEIKSIQETFEKLKDNFPNIETFKKQYEVCTRAIAQLEGTISTAQNLSDQSLVAMDMMQYQDIHRQKIERVINVMRSLSKYMSSLFEGKIEDEKRVSSATHIVGDTTEDVVDEDDIEALIAAFGK